MAGASQANAGLCEIGKTYGPFRIQRVLGEGGTAVVYLAEHVSLRADVALKVLRPEFLSMPEFVERFRGEGRALWELQHPNVVRVFHADDHAELGPYISMEVLKGKSLMQLLSRSRLPPKLALSILMKLASALGRVHAAGIIHRDLKPENIFICPGTTANEVEAKLLDFGAAKIPKYEHRPTAAHRMMGTTLYVSPEQLRADDITPASDVYTLGVIAHEMLSGEHPFLRDRTRKEATHALVGRLHLAGAIPPLSEVAPELGGDLSAVIARATALDPAMRFQSMAEFAEALASVKLPEGEPPRAPPTVPLPTLRRPPMSYREVLAIPTALGAWRVEDLDEAETVARPAIARMDASLPEPHVVAWLEMDDGSARYPIREGENIVGRYDADILIEEASLSGRHARISARGPHMTIEDQKSSNGMKINGKRLLASALHLGDLLQLGRVRLRVVPTTDVDTAETEVFRSPSAQPHDASIAETVTDGAVPHIPPSPVRTPMPQPHDASIAETVTDGAPPPVISYPAQHAARQLQIGSLPPQAYAAQPQPSRAFERQIITTPPGWIPPPPSGPHDVAFEAPVSPTLSADQLAAPQAKPPVWLGVALAGVVAIATIAVTWFVFLR